MKIDGFIFRTSYWSAIQKLPLELQPEAFRAIVEYGVDNSERFIENGIVGAVVDLIKPHIDADNKQFRRATRSKSKDEPSGNSSGDVAGESKGDLSGEFPVYIKELDIDKHLKELFKSDIIIDFLSKQTNYYQIARQVESKGRKQYREEQFVELDKLQRLDGYTLEQIEQVVQFILADEFRCDKILSIAKLRRKDRDKSQYMAKLLDSSNRKKTIAKSKPVQGHSVFKSLNSR